MSHDVRRGFNEYLISNNFPSDLLCSVLYHYHYFAIFEINSSTLLCFGAFLSHCGWQWCRETSNHMWYS